ncbi:MAG: hypothetical protein DIU69_00005 [Bacillota bacterium]|nr:MAG: hypothetical protein DIU69_00005 [Bacillota bacterium]
MPVERLWRWVAWVGVDTPGVEQVAIWESPRGWRAESLWTGVVDSHPARVAFTVELTKEWQVRRLVASTHVPSGGSSLSLERTAAGTWEDGNGPRQDLRGCEFVDIAWTPFTNTLPIRRLEQLKATSQEITVVYVSFPDLALRAARQRYTRLPGGRWRYESLESGYRAELTVNADGLVLEYPGLFRQVALWPSGDSAPP